ncbi:metallophosphoesterase [Bradyrhizobium diazoefficiens]|uniref:Phosphatase n=2 Tax=Bradyrhizobium diazoefficiens TaxID=1355477 RepID=A0A809ZQI1_9BRAD|nr:phosphatase [Bradyrhizobium diazoefficiens]BCE46065.1 phosphatase [Bradyrhizobium diazoefficiens]BCE54826.1 phosphatase [Bradyrhizobium diazoefficiens]BCE63558.1 phosphatase [Bradyrhizobium diazoefficiens]BCE89590.1 phosphatase [Bradyrhizobium diazoefficiens]
MAAPLHTDSGSAPIGSFLRPRDKLRLWVMSDIHLELTRGWDLPAEDARPQFDVLVVAGDLVPRAERGVKWLLEHVNDRPVIYVLGNHEFYGTDVDRTVEKAQAAAAGTNVRVLQNGIARTGNVTFAGCTLWTDFAINGDARRSMAIAAERMNDFRKIRTNRYAERFRPSHALARHKDSRAFLEAELRRPRGDEKFVIVSHHAPIPEMSVSPSGSGDDPALDAAFRSDLRALMSPAPDDGRGELRPADLWVFGHTHQSFDAVVGGSTRVLSNAKGYGPWPGQQATWDNQNFDEKLVIEI